MNSRLLPSLRIPYALVFRFWYAFANVLAGRVGDSRYGNWWTEDQAKLMELFLNLAWLAIAIGGYAIVGWRLARER